MLSYKKGIIRPNPSRNDLWPLPQKRGILNGFFVAKSFVSPAGLLTKRNLHLFCTRDKLPPEARRVLCLTEVLADAERPRSGCSCRDTEDKAKVSEFVSRKCVQTPSLLALRNGVTDKIALRPLDKLRVTAGVSFCVYCFSFQAKEVFRKNTK